MKSFTIRKGVALLTGNHSGDMPAVLSDLNQEPSDL